MRQCDLRWGALQMIHEYECWKGGPDFIQCWMVIIIYLQAQFPIKVGVFSSRNWRRSVNSARKRCKLLVYAVSERATPYISDNVKIYISLKRSVYKPNWTYKTAKMIYQNYSHKAELVNCSVKGKGMSMAYLPAFDRRLHSDM